MNRILNLKGNTIMGLEIHTGSPSSSYWAYTLVKQVKKSVIIVKQEYFQENFDIDKFSSLKFNKKIPIVLNFTGVNVLIEDATTNNLLMGIAQDELFIKKYTPFTSAIYQEHTTRYIEDLYGKGYFVWDIELSSLVVSNLLTLLQTKNQTNEIRYTDISINLSNTTTINLIDTDDNPSLIISNLQTSCLIGEEVTSFIYLPSLASALNFFMDNNESEYPIIETCRKECRANALTHKLLYTFLGLIFVVLLLNVLLFQSYNSTYSAVQSLQDEQKQQKQQVILLNKTVSQKESILQQVVPPHNIPLSYLADQFAACIPEKVRLNKLEIDPVEGKIKEGKAIIFRRGIIRAEGICDFPENFADLLKQLTNKTWVSRINKKEYKSTPEGGFFIVEVSYGE